MKNEPSQLSLKAQFLSNTIYNEDTFIAQVKEVLALI